MKKVFFNIPLASQLAETLDWDHVVLLLQRTLRSVLNQNDPNFEVLLCSHDRPSIPEMEDPRVHFLFADGERITDIQNGIADKARKRRQIFREIGRQGGGYVVLLDGDDLVSSRLVSYMRTVNSQHGYTFRVGYGLDLETGNCGPIPGVWNKPFTDVCGSSAAIYLTPDDMVALNGEIPYSQQFKQHAHWEKTAAEAGRPLYRVPFPCVIYTLNSRTSLHQKVSDSRAARMSDIAESIRDNRLDFDDSLLEEFCLNSGSAKSG